MLKKFVFGLVVVLLALSVISFPAVAQDPDDGAASKGEVLPESDEGNSAEPVSPPAAPPPPTQAGQPGQSLVPPGDMPGIDLSNLQLSNGQTLPNPETLKQQYIALVNSLSPEQRAQIKAILDANPPAYMEAVKGTLSSPEAGEATRLAPDQVLAIDKAGREWSAGVNAAIKGVLTPEQAAAFDSTLLPHPQDWAARLGVPFGDITPQTQSDCFYAYYYGYNYVNYYAYYQYLYAYYAYLYESDPYNYDVYSLGYDAYLYSYYAYLYSYYAYIYYYDYTYSFYSYYFSGHSDGFTYHGHILAYASYTWTGGTYAYYSYYYGYYANINSTAGYGYYCWAG
jgi:hypothetical protein